MSSIRRKALASTAALAAGAGLALGAVLAAPAVATGPETTYLVLTPEGSTAKAEARVAAAGGTVVANYKQIGVLVARSTNAAFETSVAGSGVQAVASTAGLGSALDDDEVIGTVESTTAEATGNPTGEPLWNLQWDMPQIDLAQAHAVTTGSPDVVVGVLDSGISSTHPDLATQIDKSKSASCLGGVVDTSEAAWNPTNSTHGTHVAGTIAAAINGVGVSGVAPGVKVASVKVVNDGGFIYPEAAVCGFVWAAEHGIQITNNSYFI
ncbi:MAG TPA: S8 family serine peptidase, partial [Actinomycetes bacterium]|nr:S8 family serine peptidase [Actinomycetes bacterium]